MQLAKGLTAILLCTAAFASLRAEHIRDQLSNPSSPLHDTSVADTSRVVDLDEIIVVTQPKESGRLRSQAVSSTMFSAADLQGLGINDTRQISLYVPSFSMPDYGSRYTSSAYIRGITDWNASMSCEGPRGHSMA